MSEHQTLSDRLANAVEAASAGVVRVAARRRQAASGIVWSQDGLVVTANHVVRRDESVVVGLADGREVAARLVGRDPSTDLALLQAEAGPLTRAEWLPPEALRVGHLVLAAGRPGHGIQVTLGVISALGGPWRTAAGGEVDRYLQTDVLMYPGFSGGPLITESGAIAGLNSSALGRGVSLAVPMATVGRVVTDLLAHGHIRRGYLGVGIQGVRLPEAIAVQLGQSTGLLINNVEEESPAARAGLMLGDVLVRLDGEGTPGPDALSALLTGPRVGRTAAAALLRGGALQEVTVTIGERG